MLDENDCVFPKFDIGSYIFELLTHPVSKSAKKHIKKTDRNDSKLITVNPASPQPVSQIARKLKAHQCLLALLLHKIVAKMTQIFFTPRVTAPVTKSVVPSIAVSLEVDIESAKQRPLRPLKAWLDPNLQKIS